MALDSTMSELPMEACYSENSRGNHWQAVSWALKAIKPGFEKRLFTESNKYTDQPLRVLTHCFMALGQKEMAQHFGEQVKNYVEDESWETFLSDSQKEGVVNFLRPGALGDVLLTGWALEGLRAQFPTRKFVYYTKCAEMAELLDVDEVKDSDLWSDRAQGKDFSLIGYPIKDGYPEVPMKKHLIEYFCEECDTIPITPKLKIDSFKTAGDYITLHVKAGWSDYKNWPTEKWECLVKKLDKKVIQLGGISDPRIANTVDMRGMTTIKETLKLIEGAFLHLGVDSFTNHAAGIFKTKSVILFGSTSPIGSGYGASNIWLKLPCSPCYRENPKISGQPRGVCNNPEGQTYDNPKHKCMNDISVAQVYSRIGSLCEEKNS